MRPSRTKMSPTLSRLLAGSTTRPPASFTSVMQRHRVNKAAAGPCGASRVSRVSALGGKGAVDASQDIGGAGPAGIAQCCQRQRYDSVAAEDLAGVVDAGRADGYEHVRL